MEACRAGREIETIARRTLPVDRGLPPRRWYWRGMRVERWLSLPLASTLATAVRVSASFAAAPTTCATTPGTFPTLRLVTEAGAFAALAALAAVAFIPAMA